MSKYYFTSIMSNDLKVGVDLFIPDEKKEEYVQLLTSFTQVKENITANERKQMNQILTLLDDIATSPFESQLNLIKVLNNQEFKNRPGAMLLVSAIGTNYQTQFMNESSISIDDMTVVEGEVAPRE